MMARGVKIIVELNIVLFLAVMVDVQLSGRLKFGL